MFELIGPGKAHTCDGQTRRDFLRVGALGTLGLTLPQYLWASQQGLIKPRHDERSCIMIFNLGAPSQLDTFDMKPAAPLEVRGPFQPISTRAADFQLSEILPRHADIADKFSIVRSCFHTAAAVHDAGWQMMQTGRQFSGGIETPHAGAVVSYLRGRRSDLPPFVVLPELMGRGGGNLPNGQAGGFLGKAHDPFALMADPSQPNFRVPDLLPPAELGSARIDRRRKPARSWRSSCVVSKPPTMRDCSIKISRPLIVSCRASKRARPSIFHRKRNKHVIDTDAIGSVNVVCLRGV